MDHFIKPVEHYQRDYNLIETYVQETATYLHKQTDQPLDNCIQYVRGQIASNGPTPLRIPRALTLKRNRHGDRVKEEVRLDEYLEDVRRSNEILAPNMTAYLHPDVKKSLLADYIIGNLEKRKVAKKEMFRAEMAGNKELAARKDNEQTSFKLNNNALSGAQVSAHNPLVNKTAHSTLTSGCRTATSYGNANNEKFLYGNRHYWMPDVVKTNFISIISHTDFVQFEATMKKFKLKCPTVEEVMACVHRCTESYWRSPNQTSIIESLVKSFSPLERAAVLFTGDFYQMSRVNPEFVRQFLGSLIRRPAPIPVEEAEVFIKAMSSNLTAYVSMMSAKELEGGTLNDAKDRPEAYGQVGAIAKNIMEVLDEYHDFIQTFWVTDNLPSSIYNLPNIVRRGVITSDTDSTIFTVQYWTEWYTGALDFSEESTAIANTMIYFSGETIRHILARFSANMGVDAKNLFRLSMKNEYYFPVFVLTSRAKHYFAYVAAREGNVYKHLETEIKGVALRSSNVPGFVIDETHALMRSCMDDVMAGRNISVKRTMGKVAEVERRIRKSIESGSNELLTRTQIKGPSSYKDPSSSNYIHYQMWEDVFADKYGHIAEPPYSAVKVSIDADNPTKLKAWLEKMKDRSIAEKMEVWLARSNRRGVTMLLLPETVVRSVGVPEEIVVGIDIRSLVSQTTESFYLFLEALGIYMKNANNTRLVSDNGWLLTDSET